MAVVIVEIAMTSSGNDPPSRLVRNPLIIPAIGLIAYHQRYCGGMVSSVESTREGNSHRCITKVRTEGTGGKVTINDANSTPGPVAAITVPATKSGMVTIRHVGATP